MQTHSDSQLLLPLPARFRGPRRRAGTMFLAMAMAGGLWGAPKLEDPKERAALPEFKVIPAAKPDEQTPAKSIEMAPFARWDRSHGDNGARRYSWRGGDPSAGLHGHSKSGLIEVSRGLLHEGKSKAIRGACPVVPLQPG